MKTSALQTIGTGLVYRNPQPHLRAIHAMHPTLSLLSRREMIVTFDIGQGAESLDYHTVLSRSTDGGKTWRLQGPLIRPPHGRRTTHTIRTSRLSDGRLGGLGGLFYRDDPSEGLTNRENFGYVPMDIITIESHDGGRSWSKPRILRPPFRSPAWEICHPIIELHDGTLLAPVATWRGWNGKLPCGDQAVAFISRDRGRTWPEFVRTFDGRKSGLIHFEQSVVQLQDGRLLAVAWGYNPKNGQTLPTSYSITADGPPVFSKEMRAGFRAQTCKLLALRDGRVLAAYRRHDKPGLWANLVRIRKNRWQNLDQTPLWLGAVSGMAGRENRSDELSGLKFGFPQMKQLPGGDILLVFWCMEDAITNIRWIRLRAGRP